MRYINYYHKTKKEVILTHKRFKSYTWNMPLEVPVYIKHLQHTLTKDTQTVHIEADNCAPQSPEPDITAMCPDSCRIICHSAAISGDTTSDWILISCHHQLCSRWRCSLVVTCYMMMPWCRDILLLARV